MHMRYVPQIHIYIYIHTQQKILLTYTSPLNRIIIHTIIIQVDVFVEIGCAIQKNMLLFLSIRILSFCNDIYIFVSRNINLLCTALFPISFSVLFQCNVLKIKKYPPLIQFSINICGKHWCRCIRCKPTAVLNTCRFPNFLPAAPKCTHTA